MTAGFTPIPDTHHATPVRVLLIQPEWPARALLKAELEERGCEVLAADQVHLALDLSLSRGFKPGVTVLDTLGLEASTDDLRALDFLLVKSPLIVLSSPQRSSPIVTILSPQLELVRPFSIGNVVEAVLGLA